MYSLARYIEIKNLLGEYRKDKSKYGAEVKKLKNELRSIDVFPDIVKIECEFDITQFIHIIDDGIKEMWKLLSQKNSNVQIILYYLFSRNMSSISNLEKSEMERPKTLADYVSQTHFVTGNMTKKYHKDDDEDKKIGKYIEGF